MHWLLNYLAQGDIKLSKGIGLVGLMGGLELIRSATFALAWYYNYTTGKLYTCEHSK